MGDLDALVPLPRKVAFRGKEVEVAPLRLAQISAFAAATRGICGRAILAAQLLEEGQSLHVGALVYDALENDTASVTEALSLVTGLPAEEIGAGTLDEVVDLIEAVVEVNHDFFFRRLPAVLQRMRPLVPPLPATPEADPEPTPEEEPPVAGSTSPSTSSSTDTGSETS